MTAKEIVSLVALATANFPQYKDKDMSDTAKLWRQMLSDMPFEVARDALLKVLATARFWPTVAEIRAAAVSITQPAIKSSIEAWGEVTDAIRKYGYSQQKKALELMSPTTREVVHYIGWRDICFSEEPAIIRSQFQKAYDSVAGRERENALIPSGIRELISQATKALPGIN